MLVWSSSQLPAEQPIGTADKWEPQPLEVAEIADGDMEVRHSSKASLLLDGDKRRLSPGTRFFATWEIFEVLLKPVMELGKECAAPFGKSLAQRLAFQRKRK